MAETKVTKEIIKLADDLATDAFADYHEQQAEFFEQIGERYEGGVGDTRRTRDAIASVILAQRNAAASEMLVCGIDPRRLVRSAVRSARPYRLGKHPKWVAVMNCLAVGSTTAKTLCREFGVDPDTDIDHDGQVIRTAAAAQEMEETT